MNHANAETRNKSKTALKDVEHKANTSTATFSNMIPDVEKISQELKTRTEEITTQVSDSFSESYQAGYDYVKKNPWKVLGIAAVAGMALGCATSMLSRRSK